MLYASSPSAPARRSSGGRSPRATRFRRAVDELWPTGALPVAGYGIEKSYVERWLDAFEARHGEKRVVRTRSAFVFQEGAARKQLRIFGGPLAPGRLVGSRLVPVLPLPAGLRFQAVHADDVAAAGVSALLRPVRGAFNLAAAPVICPRDLSIPAHVGTAACTWRGTDVPAGGDFSRGARTWAGGVRNGPCRDLCDLR